MGEFCLPLAQKYIGPNSQGRLTLSYALSVDLSNTLTRRSVGADNFQKEHTSNRVYPLTFLNFPHYLIYPFYPCRLDECRGLYRRPDEDLTAPPFFVATMVRRRRLSCLPSRACPSLYCQFECPSLSCINFAGRRQLLTSQSTPKPACR